MKKYAKIVLVAGGLMVCLISCQCKTCRKDSEISIQICRGDVSEQDYNYAVAAQEANGYACN